MEASAKTILLVGLTAADRELVQQALASGGRQPPVFLTADTGAQALALCRATPPACLLVAAALPDMAGSAWVAALHTQSSPPDASIILVTPPHQTEATLTALRHGVHDFLVQGRMASADVQRAVQNAMEKVELRRSLRETQEALRASDERFYQLFSHVGVGITLARRDGSLLDVNPGLCQMLGYSRDELIGRPVFDLIHPEDRAATLRLVDEVLAGARERYTVERRLLRQDGSPIWVNVAANPVRDAHGRILFAVAMMQDITERKRAEQNREFLSELLAQIRPLTDPEAIRWAAIEALGVYLKATRCTLNEVDPDTAEVTIARPWHRVDAPSRAGQYKLTDLVPPEVIGASAAGRTLVIYDTARDPRSASRYPTGYGRVGVGALVSVPCLTEGRWVALLSVHSAAPRVWRDDEVALIEAVAAQVWPAIVQAQTEQALRESEQVLSLAMRSSRMGAWSRDVATNQVWWSRELEELFGLPPGGFKGTEDSFYEYVLAEDQPGITREIAAALAERRDYVIEFRFRHRDGGVRWMEGRGRAVYSPEGEATTLYGIGMDITERKAGEEALRRANLRFELAEAAARAFVYEWDRTQDRVERTAGFTRVMGYAVGEIPLTSDGWRGLIHPEDLEAVAAQNVAFAGENGIFDVEYRARHKDGHYVHLWDRSVVLNDDQGRPTRVVGITADISARKQAEDALVRSERTVRLLYEGARQLGESLDTPAIYHTLHRLLSQAIPHDGLIVSAYEPDESLIRCEYAWVDGQTLDPAIFPPLSFKASSGGMQSEVIRTGRGLLTNEVAQRVQDPTGTFYEVTSDGTLKSLPEAGPPKSRAALMVPIKLEGGVRGVVQIMSDQQFYTEEQLALLEGIVAPLSVAMQNAKLYQSAREELEARKAAEAERERLLQRERTARAAAEAANRTKDEFLATVSHELRTPLTAILGWSSMLRAGKGREAVAARALEVIEQSARAQAQLIEDILDVSRIITGKLKLNVQHVDPCPLVQAAATSVRLAAEAKSLQLDVECDGDVGLIAGDADRLQQVTWNLLSNAVKFTPAGGRVEVHLQRQANEVELTVRDTGIGISPDFLPYVFERFSQADSTSTRSYEGLGLGLAIVRHIVEMHGGTVRAASPGPNQGATFTVYLPVAGPSANRSTGRDGAVGDQTEVNRASLSDSEPRLPGVRILVVDDDEPTLELLQVILTGQGAEVRICASASEAVAALREWWPQVVVSDVAMPGEDGYTLIARVRALRQALGRPLLTVALTAYARSEDRRRALAAGYDDYLPKPVTPHDLVTTIAALVQGAQAGDT
ncbi:MAG: PAS domain S-box protein [Anaerolineae bacterium]|nr:PAS domain S-box protein [Anaerolineae bacterium]